MDPIERRVESESDAPLVSLYTAWHEFSLRPLARTLPVTSFFVLAYAFLWGFHQLLLLCRDGTIPLEHPAVFGYLASTSPGVAALVLVGTLGGWAAARDLVSRLLRWRASLGVWLVALGLPTVLSLVSVVVAKLIAPSSISFAEEIPLEPGSIVVGAVWFVFAAAGEEIGWRGFALPRLIARRGPLSASVVIGIVWAAWHFVGSRPWPGAISAFGFGLGIVSDSIVITWIFQRSNESLLLTTAYHAIHNANVRVIHYLIPGKLAASGAILSLLKAIVVIVIVVRNGWLRTVPTEFRDNFVSSPPPPDADATASSTDSPSDSIE
ncbi:MAG: CPBP family intramembrane metalloprotease [Planctomycetes bacterium]|nr:CPBP family intramembrane metalloprotease [Planctomycetota bacterium]MBI3845524.1 CPBP family intramembrane metalloprotease [Planctomycetota bacterium]